MQEYFLNPTSHAYLPAAEAIIEPIKRLQSEFEKRNNEVFFFQYGLKPNSDDTSMMKRWWKGVLTTEDEMYKISPKFDLTNAHVIKKELYDAFVGTDLAIALDKLGYDKIVITGVATHLCCESTARSAFDHEFEVYLPIDCLATYNEEMHLNSLKAASHGFGIPITSDEILESK
jgi:isochorismate hydrolase